MRAHQNKKVAGFLVAALMAIPAWADNTSPERAVPGTLNYVEGAVSIGSQRLSPRSIGSAQLETGKSLTTKIGKAEILLTPGVFLRIGKNSSVKMLSSSLTDTGIGLENGHAMVEVAEIHRENDIRIVADGTTTTLLKTGLYDFDLRQQQLRVFDGRARVDYARRHVNVKSGREVSLVGTGQVKPYKFNKKAYGEGDLYRWSSLRSAYVAEANVNAAALYANSGLGPWGAGWWGAGWYWDPWFDGFTFIPGDGIFFSPFGWGFYSPWCVYAAPIYGGYGLGYPGIGVHHQFSTNPRNWGPGSHYIGSRDYTNGVYRGPGSSGEFHSGPRFGNSREYGGGGIRGVGFPSGDIRSGGYHDGGFHSGGLHGGGGMHRR